MSPVLGSETFESSTTRSSGESHASLITVTGRSLPKASGGQQLYLDSWGRTRSEDRRTLRSGNSGSGGALLARVVGRFAAGFVIIHLGIDRPDVRFIAPSFDNVVHRRHGRQHGMVLIVV